MEHYQRLALSEREETSRYLTLNYSYRQIAACLHRSPSTICREIKRQSCNRQTYRAVCAHKRSYGAAHNPRKKRKLDSNIFLQRIVMKYLALRCPIDSLINVTEEDQGKSSGGRSEY